MRIGIIGCGLIGQKRAAAAKDHQIVCVADPTAQRAEALAQKTGALVAKDWEDVVKSDVDIICVATPHDRLAEIAEAAVVAGKHVLVEKPAGRNAAEIGKVAEAARKHKKIVKVGYNHRFHPALQKAKEIYDAGTIGPILFIRGRYGHGGRPGYEKEWRCTRAISGGGELIDQGSHLLDLSAWFIGTLKLDYAALPTSFWPIEVEDNCFMALRGAQDEMAWLHASWSEWKNLFCFEIMGKVGKLTVDGLGGSYGVEKLTLHKMLPEMGPPETTVWEFPFPDESWTLEFADFVNAIDNKRRPCGDIEDALAHARLIDQMYKGTRT